MSIWEFFKEEWGKIPYYSKIYGLIGVIFIYIAWLIDHWGKIVGQPENEVYKFWFWDIRQFCFSFGLTIILIVFLSIPYKNMKERIYISKYRNKYRMKKLDEDFYLRRDGGRYYLFDRKTKLYHHVRPWQTALDLYFDGLPNKIQGDFKFGQSYKFPDEENIDGTYNAGEQINTRP